MSDWTLLSWNVLADSYIRAGYYPHTDSSVLKPGARTAAIVDRVFASDCDVVCLQEVETPLVEVLQRTAAARGYSVRFAGKGAGRPDGVALLSRNKCVEILQHRALVFADGAAEREVSGHVALVVDAKINGQPIGIVTTHLRWDRPGTPTAQRWATAQARDLLAATLAGEWVLCGDFNFTPDDQVYAQLVHGGFVDVFAAARAPTALTNGRAQCIDYILHTAGMQSLPRVGIGISAAHGLPSLDMPSDHVPLAATLSLKRLS